MSETKSHVDVKMGSERGFGITFAVVFALIGLFPLVAGSGVIWWALAVAAVFLALGLCRPSALRLLNRAWFKFGMLLGAVIAPIVMGLVFVITVIPVGLIMRLLGKDILRLKIDRDARSYWIERKEPVGSMRNQF